MKHKFLLFLAFSLALVCQASVDLNTDNLQREYVQIRDVADELDENSGELNETDILHKKMYRPEKKEEVKKTPEEVYLEEEKKRTDERLNDELITKIVVGVFVFTIFLWCLSKYFEWKYKRQGAELSEEAEKVEKEYKARYDEYNSKKNKKRR